MRRGDGYADLSYVFKAVEELTPASAGLYRYCDKIDSSGRHQPGN